MLLEILHRGTKYNILGLDDGTGENEEFITSICKSNFSIFIKRTLTCINCNSSSTNFISSLDFHVYPSSSKELESLIFETMTSTLSKACECSNGNTVHSEISEFEELPRILFIIINRYNYSHGSNKNEAFVTLNKQLLLNGLLYNHSATIYHHGAHTSSGHYTAKILYTDVAYNCDDSRISSIDVLQHEKSNSCYIVLYIRAD